MKKRGIGITVILLSLIFLTGFLSAQSCSVKLRAACNVGGGEYVVMGLTSSTNAHGAFPDTGDAENYPYVLCCDFGGGDTSCLDTAIYEHPAYGFGTPRNKIIGLHSSTNSHAESTERNTYPINVCYKDLVCVSSIESCSSNYPRNIMNLSSLTNAHIGYGTGYPVAICCQVYSGILGPSCALNSAQWQYNSVLDKAKVEMIVGGESCPRGTAVNFDIYKKRTGADQLMESISGSYDSHVWTAVWKYPEDNEGGTNARTYYFLARATVAETESQSGDISVSERPYDYCTRISLCSSYTTDSECNTDYCDVALKNENCDIGATGIYGCSCSWNDLSGTCEFATDHDTTGAQDGGIRCGHGYTLCYDEYSELNYCYPGNECPNDENPLSDGDGVCELGEGCLSADCNDGDVDSCVDGATCLNEMCYIAGETAVSPEGCEHGYSLCYNSVYDLYYCYPGNECPNEEESISEEDGVCGFGEGCSSPDCANSDPDADPELFRDSCLGDAFCLNGVCYSPSATIGKCRYTETINFIYK